MNTSDEPECQGEGSTLLVIDPGTADTGLLIAVLLLAGVKKAGFLEPGGKIVPLI